MEVKDAKVWKLFDLYPKGCRVHYEGGVFESKVDNNRGNIPGVFTASPFWNKKEDKP